MANEIEVRLVLDDGTYKKAIVKTEKQSKKTGKKIGENLEGGAEKKLTSLFTGLKASILGVGAAFATSFALRSVIRATIEQENAVKKLNQSLINAGTYSKQTSKDFQDFAAGLQQITGIGDEVILDVLGLARQFARTDEEARKMVQASLDLSAATGLTLEGSVKNLGKTMSGLTGELGESVAELRNLTQAELKSGQAIDLVSKKFEGFARAQGETTSGQLQKLSSNFSDLLEKIGSAISQSPLFINSIKGINNALISLNNYLSDDTGKAFSKMEQRVVDAFERSSIAVSDARAQVNALTEDLQEKKAGGFFETLALGSEKALVGKLTAAKFQLEVLVDEEKRAEAEFQKILDARSKLAALRGGGEDAGLSPQEQSQRIAFQQQLAAATGKRIESQITGLKLVTDFEQFRTRSIELEEEKRASIEESFLVQSDALRKQFSDRKIVSQQELNNLILQLEAEKNEQLLTLQSENLLATQDNFQNFKDGMSMALAELVVNAKSAFQQMGKAAIQGLGQAAGSAFAAFGKAIAQGENALQAFLNSLLASMGQMAIQLGTQFILQGIAYTYAGMPNGPSLIAAGAGLAAFGGILSGLGGGAGESAGGAGGGVGGGGLEASPTSSFDEQEIVDQGPRIAVNIQGNVLDRKETGLEIVEIINEAFEQQGAVVRTA